MNKLNPRQEKIIEILRRSGSVDVDQLSAELNVTTQTIRRDLAVLCGQNLATRTHGGARRLVSSVSLDYEKRRLANSTSKIAIATQVAALIGNGSSVILNIGTTTEQVASALSLHQDLTVITNNINVVHTLRPSQVKALILVGGTVRASDGAIVGEDAVNHMSQYKADFAIIGTSSLDEDGSVLDFDSREVAVARAILRNARVKVLVTDTSKFEIKAPVRICNAEDLDYVVMDTSPPQTFQDALREAGTNLIIADAIVDRQDG